MHSDDFSLRLESGCIQNEEILVFRSNEVLFSSRVESDWREADSENQELQSVNFMFKVN